MFHVMTLEIALALKSSLVFKFQSSSRRVGNYDGNIKINKIAIIRGVALAETDSVWIMASRTGRIAIFYMSIMFFEAFIIQDTLAIMTAVT